MEYRDLLNVPGVVFSAKFYDFVGKGKIVVGVIDVRSSFDLPETLDDLPLEIRRIEDIQSREIVELMASVDYWKTSSKQWLGMQERCQRELKELQGEHQRQLDELVRDLDRDRREMKRG